MFTSHGQIMQIVLIVVKAHNSCKKSCTSYMWQRLIQVYDQQQLAHGAKLAHTLRIDYETLAGRHSDCQVGDFISVPVAKASIKGVPVSREQGSDVFQAPDFKLMRTPQDLPKKWNNQ